jgi:hypothetical protein
MAKVLLSKEQLRELADRGTLLAARLHEAVLAMRPDTENRLSPEELRALTDTSIEPNEEEEK